jgi:hypothetical protein
MLKELIKIASELDQRSLSKEADIVDSIIHKLSGDLISFEEFKRIEEEHSDKDNHSYMIVLDDMETYSGDGFIAQLSPEEMDRVSEGESIEDVASHNKMINIFDTIEGAGIDLSRIFS